jgi:hypothetical protein
LYGFDDFSDSKIEKIKDMKKREILDRVRDPPK